MRFNATLNFDVYAAKCFSQLVKQLYVEAIAISRKPHKPEDCTELLKKKTN